MLDSDWLNLTDMDLPDIYLITRGTTEGFNFSMISLEVVFVGSLQSNLAAQSAAAMITADLVL